MISSKINKIITSKTCNYLLPSVNLLLNKNAYSAENGGVKLAHEDTANLFMIKEKIKETCAPGFMKLAFTDIDGVMRGKYVNDDKFVSAVEKGLGVCSVVFGWDVNDMCYDNITFTGDHTGYPDIAAEIDLSSFRTIREEFDTPGGGEGGRRVPFFFLEFKDTSGNPLPQCPRALLQTIVADAKKQGLGFKVGMELEWFNFKETPQSLQQKSYTNPEPLTPGNHGYSLLRSGQNLPFFRALMEDTRAANVPLEGVHTETGPGVYEIAIQCSDPVEQADRTALFKLIAKHTGHRFGIIPCFMAKWNTSYAGSSGHLHQSVIDIESGKNLFYDSENEMSTLMKQYMAGQLHCMPHILPMFAPNVNSYKRHVEGFWAPTSASWGVENRTAALRVIQAGPSATRLETRIGGADVNPYLNAAASIASGLYGIKHNLSLPEAIVGSNQQNSSKVSNNLYEAANIMKESEVAKELFGNDFVEHFTATRLWEWRQFQKAVTNWELERYFEII